MFLAKKYLYPEKGQTTNYYVNVILLLHILYFYLTNGSNWFEFNTDSIDNSNFK